VKDVVKVIPLLKRKDSVSQEEFSRYWEQKHEPLVAKIFPSWPRAGRIPHEASRVLGKRCPEGKRRIASEMAKRLT